MRPIDPAERIRLTETAIILQRLRREMGLLSETDEEYNKKKHALAAVIEKLQSGSDVEAHAVSSAHRPTQAADKKRGCCHLVVDAGVPVVRR